MIADAKATGDTDAEATVHVRAGRAASVVGELGPAAVRDERPDGSVVVVVPCANPWAFRSWLLEMGDQAEVLGPPTARADVVAWLEAVAATGAAS